MHHNHHLFWHFRPKKELNQVYISVILRNFALSLVSLFVPLYLYYEIGYTLEQTLYFFIFYAVIFAISTPLAAKFCSRYGVKHSVLLSVPFYLAFVLLLYLLSHFTIPLFLPGAFLGLSISFYWMGLHNIFYHASHRKHRGEETGKRTALSILASMFGPLIGGLLIKFIGFWIVFVLASVVLLSSALILFLSKEEYVNYKFSFKSVVDKEHWKYSLFFVSRGSRVIAEGVIWPLFIFLILKDYFTLGLMGFVLSGVSAFIIFAAGKYSDHHYSKGKILHFITGFESLAWFLRSLVTTTGHIFAVVIFGAITQGIREAPMSALEYDRAKGNPAAYFVNREIFICFGRILLLVFVLMTDSLSGGLIFHGFANLAAFLF